MPSPPAPPVKVLPDACTTPSSTVMPVPAGQAGHRGAAVAVARRPVAARDRAVVHGDRAPLEHEPRPARERGARALEAVAPADPAALERRRAVDDRTPKPAVRAGPKGLGATHSKSQSSTHTSPSLKSSTSASAKAKDGESAASSPRRSTSPPAPRFVTRMGEVKDALAPASSTTDTLFPSIVNPP